MYSRNLLFLLLLTSSVRAEENPGNANLARTIHSLIVPQVPKQHEDLSAWGKTIPFPADLRRPGLRRTVIMVQGRPELPQGPWVKTKVWFDDPARNIEIRVAEQRKIDEKNTRLVLEATISLHGERQRQQWLKGLKLVDLVARADVVVLASFDIDVAVDVKPGKILPEVKVEPKVVQTKLNLKRFDVQGLDVMAGPVAVQVRDLGNELRDNVQDWLRKAEPNVSTKLNELLAKGAKEGKLKLFAPKP